jgi:Adenylosuccinate synthetase
MGFTSLSDVLISLIPIYGPWIIFGPASRQRSNTNGKNDARSFHPDTTNCPAAPVIPVSRAYSRSTDACVDVLVGGQYGSEGKGNIVGHIAPEYELLVRVANAGHKVFATPEPEAYFHLPSGSSRAPKATLLLGAGAVIYTPKLLDEIARHHIDVERLFIDPQAMIIEETDKAEEIKLLSSIASGRVISANEARRRGASYTGSLP